MKNVPIVIGRPLSNQKEPVPSRRRTVRLLVPGKLVLKTPTDSTGIELGKVIILVNLHSEDPTPGKKIDIATQLSAVREPDGVILSK